jgi:hypothetical protein
MNYASTVAGRAMLSVDYLLNRAMTYAWTSTLQRRCPGSDLPSGSRLQLVAKKDFGGGFFLPEAEALTEDNRPF